LLTSVDLLLAYSNNLLPISLVRAEQELERSLSNGISQAFNEIGCGKQGDQMSLGKNIAQNVAQTIFCRN
jgi:hypothetical protein